MDLLSSVEGRAPGEPLIEAAADRVAERPRTGPLQERQQAHGAKRDRKEHENEDRKDGVQHGHIQPEALANRRGVRCHLVKVEEPSVERLG